MLCMRKKRGQVNSQGFEQSHRLLKTGANSLESHQPILCRYGGKDGQAVVAFKDKPQPANLLGPDE